MHFRACKFGHDFTIRKRKYSKSTGTKNSHASLVDLADPHVFGSIQVRTLHRLLTSAALHAYVTACPLNDDNDSLWIAVPVHRARASLFSWSRDLWPRSSQP